MLLFIFMNQKLEYLNCAKTIIRRLLFTNPNEKLQIATVSTKNEVNTEPEEVSIPTIELVDYIDQLIDKLLSSNGSLDEQNNETKLKVGFQVVLQMITNIKEKENDETMPKGRRKTQNTVPTEVIMFTNLQNAKFSETLSQKYIDEFKNENIKMYIFTENISYPIPENTIAEDLPIILTNPSLLPSELSPLQQIIVETDGFIGNINFGTSLFESIKYKKLSMAWNVNFSIGNEIIIPISGYRKTDEYSEPKFVYKKRPNEEETIVEQPLKKSDYQETTSKDESYLEEDKKIFDVYTTSEGERGYLTAEERKAHQPKTIRCLDLLFTMDKSEVNEIHHEKPIYILKPITKDMEIINTFNAFVNELVEKNLVGIARKCYNKNNFPKLVVLRPYKVVNEIVIESFLLPFKDNCVYPIDFLEGTTGLWKSTKNFKLNSIEDDGRKLVINAEKQEKTDRKQFAINAEIQEHANDFLNELKLKENDYTSLLPPQLQFNPKLDYLYQRIIEKAKQSMEKKDKTETYLEEDCESNLNNLNIENWQPEFIKKRANDALNELILKL